MQKHSADHLRVVAYVEDLADQIHEELLADWADSDEGPLPTREQALREAERQAVILIRALGPMKRQPAELLDTMVNGERSRLRRSRRRNAWPKGEVEEWPDERWR